MAREYGLVSLRILRSQLKTSEDWPATFQSSRPVERSTPLCDAYTAHTRVGVHVCKYQSADGSLSSWKAKWTSMCVESVVFVRFRSLKASYSKFALFTWFDFKNNIKIIVRWKSCY